MVKKARRPKPILHELSALDAEVVVRGLVIAYEQTRRAAKGNVRAPMIAEATDYALVAKQIIQTFPNLQQLIANVP